MIWALLPRVRRKIASRNCSPTEKTGLSDVCGSCRIIEIPTSADLAHLPARAGKDIVSTQANLAAHRACAALRQQPHDGQCREALAAAQLADETEDLAALEGRS